MQLELLHPDVAFRDCQHCCRYAYHEEGGQKGQVILDRHKRPMLRPPGTHPPCRREGAICPKGSPEKPVILTEANRETWEHYKRCKLTGRWPDDAWAIELGATLDDVMRQVERIQQIEMMAALIAT